MTKQAHTRDEIFLLKLHQMSNVLGDPFQEIDRYVVGKAIGQNHKSVDNIVRMLARTNFIKKGDGDAIYMTQQGIALIEILSG